MSFIPNLQGLRAFAAMNVVSLHAMGNANDYFGHMSITDTLNGWGASGVDIFFVLSGFIMVHTQLKPGFSFERFVWGRVSRIFPVYFFLTGFVVLLFVLSPGLFREAQYTAGHVLASLTFTSQPILGLEPVIGYGWTLEYEMLFYLTFGVLIALGVSRTLGVLLGLVPIAMGLTLFAGVSFMFFEFLFGVAAAAVFRAVRPAPLVGAALFGMGVIGLISAIFFPDVLHRVIAWGLPSTLLVLGAAWMWQTRSDILVHVGNASYSTYLVQVLTVPGTMKAVQMITADCPSWIAAAVALIVTPIVGSLVYYTVEVPAMSLSRTLSIAHLGGAR